MGVEQAAKSLKNKIEKKLFNQNNNTSSRNNSYSYKKKTLPEPIQCPFCLKVFDCKTTFKDFNIHIKKCVKVNKSCDIYPSGQDATLNSIILKNINKYKIINNNKNKNAANFIQKVENLKTVIQTVKISWQEGCCQLNLDRQNFLADSMDQINNIDLHKELKINFIGEVSYDAGGIIREWFTTLFQKLEGEKLNLFIVSDSNDFSYIINPFLIHNEENYKYFIFIGKLIAKALMDNITINICFNKLIYKMILQEEITYDDLVFIDNPLYNSIKNLKESQVFETNDEQIIKDLALYYSIEMKDSFKHIHSFELIENGKNILVTDLNDYIKRRINFMIGIYEPFISKIRQTLFKYYPKDVIDNFTSDELELVINGRPFIDVEEWKMFTEYKTPYSSQHYIIIWFWEILEKLSQKELSNLLLFCTGSARVPLGGFEVLESNRGNIAKFTIENIPYIKGKKNFVKAHTCFNRLDIPMFQKKEELEEAIKFVSTREILGFGID